jgi:hypothetical protein
MSNYPESNDPSYAGNPPPGSGYPQQGTRPEEQPYQQGGAPAGPPRGAQQYGGEQYPGGPMHQQQTQQFSSYGGSSSYQGGGGRRGFDLRSTFKTTEFWIFVVVSLGALITAAIVDEDIADRGFSAWDAWRLVTVLAVAYMISRGMTKFGGHERD